MDADPYQILGVSRTASAFEIHEAYLRLLRQYHPDVYRGNPAVALATTKALNGAYETLKDSGRSREYDSGGRVPTSRPAPSPEKSDHWVPEPSAEPVDANWRREYRGKWVDFGVGIEMGRTPTREGKTYTSTGCYVNAVKWDPDNSDAWCNLGGVLKFGETVIIGAIPFSKRECYIMALEANPNNLWAWKGLGDTLGEGEKVSVAGKTYDSMECYRKLKELDPVSWMG